MGNVRKKNKPKKVVQTTLDVPQRLLVIEEWGKGESLSEIQHKHFLPENLIQNVFDACGVVQNKCDELMESKSPPSNEVTLKARINILQIDNSNEIVDVIIKYSDVNNNGTWEMYQNYEWGTE